MENFTLSHAKLLYLRFCAIYGEKFVKNYHDEDFKAMWQREWMTGLEGIDISVVKDVLERCKKELEWPPSIAEFIRFCEEASGLPSCNEALACALRREFNHPVTRLAYDKVGSWDMRNCKEVDLQRKFKDAYQDALKSFRQDQEGSWKQLEVQNALPDPTKIPSKIPTQEECLSFRERMKQYQNMSVKKKDNNHPKWDKDIIMRGHKNFDEKVYNERKRYLLELPEIDAGSLSTDDWYDRTRFLRELEGIERVKNNPHREDVTQDKKTRNRSFNGPTVVYKNWMTD
jgi:hypothetical protein